MELGAEADLTKEFGLSDEPYVRNKSQSPLAMWSPLNGALDVAEEGPVAVRGAANSGCV